MWVRRDRPRSAAELSAATVTAAADGQAAELAARWDREPEWDGRMMTRPGRDDDMCAECRSVPVEWEPGRTLTYCPECRDEGHPAVALPVAVVTHYERQERVSQEIATRTAAAPDRAAERAARVQLRARKQQARDYVGRWLDTVADPDMYDRDQWQRQAAELAALLGAFLPEIDHAESEAELGAVLADIRSHLESQLGTALQAEWEAAQQRAEAAVERARYQHEREAAEAEAERQAAEAERQAERERQRQAAELAAQQRKAIGSGSGIADGPYAGLAVMIATAQQRKEQRLSRKGACGWRHTWGQAAAERVYAVPARDWRGDIEGIAPGTTYYRACSKHFEAAEAQLVQAGYSDIAWWPAEDVADA